MPTVKLTRGTATNVLTTELNSLANNANALGAAITFSTGEPGYLQAEAELLIAGMGGTPTANTTFTVWLLREIDGTNYEDGGTSVTPTRVPDIIFPIRAVATAQRIIQVCSLPPGNFKALVRNDATGQAMAASGNCLKLRPMTESW
jgi:hypothetical protein